MTTPSDASFPAYSAPYDPGLIPSTELEDDDWDEAPITPRARMPRFTKLLAVLLVAAAAFAGGIFAQRHWGTSSSSQSAAGGRDAFTAPGGSPAASSGQSNSRSGAFAGGAVTVGQVSHVKGRTLYVTDSSGNTVKVTVPKGSRVTKSVTSSVRGIRPGDSVVISGTQAKSGAVTATSVSVGGAGGGLFAGAPGGGGGGGSGAPTGFGG